jgi:probable HAF family extracellular repeat protein
MLGTLRWKNGFDCTASASNTATNSHQKRTAISASIGVLKHQKWDNETERGPSFAYALCIFEHCSLEKKMLRLRASQTVLAGRLWLAACFISAWLAGCGGNSADTPQASLAGTTVASQSLASSGSGNGKTRMKGGWVLTDLGTLGGTYSQANGINNLGEVVGGSWISGDNAMHAFLYRNGGMTDLGTLGGSYTWANDINDVSQVVGVSEVIGDSSTRAFLYQDGSMADLGTLGGTNSGASGINNDGQVVGTSNTTGDAASHAFIYRNGSMADLGTLNLASGQSSAAAINRIGQVVGQATSADGIFGHAFFYSDGSMSDLGTLSGLDGPQSFAQGVNDSGDVVGTSYFTGGIVSDQPHAFLYTKTTGMADLGTLNGPGGYPSSAYAINNAGQIVGTSQFGSEDNAFLYQDGKMFNLNQLQVIHASGWILEKATAINDAGQIAGSGRINGETHAYLLTPLPSAIRQQQ